MGLRRLQDDTQAFFYIGIFRQAGSPATREFFYVDISQFIKWHFPLAAEAWEFVYRNLFRGGDVFFILFSVYPRREAPGIFLGDVIRNFLETVLRHFLRNTSDNYQEFSSELARPANIEK